MKTNQIISAAIYILLSLSLTAVIYITTIGQGRYIPTVPTPSVATSTALSEPSTAETEPRPAPVSVTISFVGDCMLATDRGGEWDGSFNALAKKSHPSYFLESFTELFESDDWTVANLENVLTDNTDAPMRNKGYSPAYWYRSSTQNTAILTEGSVEIVSLANNHSEDYGAVGYADTRAALEDAGVLWGDNNNIVMLEKDGFTIALYCTTFYYKGYESVISNKMAQVDADYKIVYFHGGTERIHKPDAWKAEGCRRMIDSGIDIVIGHHPHVLQPIEVYNGKTIVHSLGNFVFGGSLREENRTIVYRLHLTACDGELISITDEVIPCYVYTDLYKPGIITNEAEIAAVHAFLSGESDSPIGE